MTWLRRHLTFVLGTALAAGLGAVALWPSAVPVDVTAVARGPLTVTLDEDGETRVHHRYMIAAPVAGRLERIALDPGDAVTRDRTVVARLRPEAPQLLDARARGEAAAAAAAARAALGRAQAERQRAATARDLAAADLARERALAASGLTTAQSLQTRELAAASANDALDAARFGEATAAAELTRASVRLRPTGGDAGAGPIAITSPVDGVVLRRFLDSETVVAAGTRLLEIGDPSHVEVVADLLSTDAVRVKPGMRVEIDEWGGDRPLGARVQRIEPAGFTKVSALGVEEQRVNVIMDLDDSRQAWEAMGDGFRVEVRIVLWTAPDVVTAPASALVRNGEAWAVFVVEGARARVQPVTPGHRTPRAVEILEGLAPGALVVVHPPDTLGNGTRVSPR